MFRNNNIRRRQSFPPLRRRRTPPSSPLQANSASTTPIFSTLSSQDQAIEALTTLLQSQREEIAAKDAALENLKTSSSISSTVAVNKLTSVPNFKSVQIFSQQFDTATHLNVLENIGVEARQGIEYEANLRGLSTGSVSFRENSNAVID